MNERAAAARGRIMKNRSRPLRYKIVGEGNHGEHGNEASHGDEDESEPPLRLLDDKGLVGGEGHHENAVRKAHDHPDPDETGEGSLVGLEARAQAMQTPDD